MFSLNNTPETMTPLAVLEGTVSFRIRIVCMARILLPKIPGGPGATPAGTYTQSVSSD